MKHQEKKYKVNSFDEIQKILNKAGARKGKETTTTHYYVSQKGNDVVKLIEYSDRSEIHMLEEHKGRFSLSEKFKVKDTAAGLHWLKDKGYKTVDLVKMRSTDYEYRNGIVGLYLVDDFLHSVILDFPEGQHEIIEQQLDLNTAQVISAPYNKYLEQLGRLRSMKLD